MTLGVYFETAREYLGLSQGYIAKLMKIPEERVNAIESNEKITNEEITKLCRIYGLNHVNEIQRIINQEQEQIIKTWLEDESMDIDTGDLKLSLTDEQAIKNLIQFKKEYKRLNTCQHIG